MNNEINKKMSLLEAENKGLKAEILRLQKLLEIAGIKEFVR